MKRSDGLGPYMERMRPVIDHAIDKLQRTKFREDPIAGRKYSRATSIISSAYKRHGQLIGYALLERLKDCERFEVWREDAFKLSYESLRQLQINDRSSRCLSLKLAYGDQEHAIPLDVVVFDNRKRTVRAYNVKRGNGAYDAGKQRSIKDELLRTSMLLHSYASQNGKRAETAEARVIFYYGIRSVDASLCLISEDLDAHFDFPVTSAIENVNECFRASLYSVIENA